MEHSSTKTATRIIYPLRLPCSARTLHTQTKRPLVPDQCQPIYKWASIGHPTALKLAPHLWHHEKASSAPTMVPLGPDHAHSEPPGDGGMKFAPPLAGAVPGRIRRPGCARPL